MRTRALKIAIKSTYMLVPWLILVVLYPVMLISVIAYSSVLDLTTTRHKDKKTGEVYGDVDEA